MSNISRLLQKFHFPVEVVLNYLQTQKGNRKVIEIGLLRFLFTEDSSKFKKGPELVPRSHFHIIF